MSGEIRRITDLERVLLTKVDALTAERDELEASNRIRGDELARLRAQEPGCVIAPHFRGYAHLGIGAYLLNNSAVGDPPELVISIASDEDKADRNVGDSKDNLPNTVIEPEQMAVRLRFESAAGLDALEQQLRLLREAHFPESAPPAQPAEPVQRLSDGDCIALMLRLNAELRQTESPTQMFITICRAIESAMQPPQGWACEIAAADFELNTVTLQMAGDDYQVSAGPHMLVPVLPLPSKV
jgi:hypothetical protein